MRTHELEHLVLEIIERVNTKQDIEDSRVELKREWIEPKKAARRLAGHANAARGESVIWLIGVDEDSGVTGASKEELSEWYAQVEKECDGFAPELDLSLIIPIDGKSVVALLFDTDRAPYVVLNPDRSSGQSHKIDREVPWRSGTRVRSAKRSDLIRLLSPLQMTPRVEVVACELAISKIEVDSSGEAFSSILKLDLYVIPKTNDSVVIPFHKCEGVIRILQSKEWHEFEGVILERSGHGTDYSRSSASTNIAISPQDGIIRGPCMVSVHASVPDLPDNCDYAEEGRVRIKLGVVDIDHPISIDLPLKRQENPSDPYEVWNWVE